MSEQNRLDQVLRHGAAVHRDERLGAARARAVDRARDQFLADAGLAFDQDRNVRSRCLLHRAQHGLHGRRAGDDVGNGERAVAAALDALQFAGEPLRGERVAQRYLQAFWRRRLDHEVGGARAHRRHHIVDAAMGGLHDHRDIEAGLAHARQHAEPVEVRHHQVEHHAIDARRLRTGEQADRGVAAVGGERQVAEALDHRLQQAALDRVVVDDEDGFGHQVLQTTDKLCRFGAMSPVWLNELLNPANSLLAALLRVTTWHVEKMRRCHRIATSGTLDWNSDPPTFSVRKYPRHGQDCDQDCDPEKADQVLQARRPAGMEPRRSLFRHRCARAQARPRQGRHRMPGLRAGLQGQAAGAGRPRAATRWPRRSSATRRWTTGSAG